MKQSINKPVTITAVGFKKNVAAYPRRMEYEGSSYSFLDAGLSCVIRKGERVAEILTLTDGIKQFRLKSDNRGGNWMLLDITA
jgi:hypothetical protein